jgi:purine-binding chemotaxis protein CheW
MNQYLSFELSEQLYCVPLTQVREVRRLGLVTAIPQSPQHMIGVVNLRGDVVPVVDLPAVLGLNASVNPQPQHIVVVVQLQERMVAFLVDSVADVFAVSSDALLTIPQTVQRYDSQFISGMIMLESREVLVLQVESILHNTLALEPA